jgi:hypothetical protein
MANFAERGEFVKCSFCAKTQKQVKKLIAGPGVYICNECVARCDEIIADEVGTASSHLAGAFEQLSERFDATREDPDAMFERFTDRARRVLVLAQEEARLLNHSFIGTEHLLLGLIHEGEGLAAKVLESFDISLEAVREKVEETIGLSGTAPAGSPPFTTRAKKVLELARRQARQLGHDHIDTEHILLGLVREGEGVASQVLVSLDADLSRVRQQVIQLLSDSGHGTVPLRRHAMRAGAAPVEPLPMSIGDSWTVQVVRAGRRPEDFAVSYERLADLLSRLGTDVDDSRIGVTSVETDKGPGLRLLVTHEPTDDSTNPSVDGGEAASGKSPE